MANKPEEEVEMNDFPLSDEEEESEITNKKNELIKGFDEKIEENKEKIKNMSPLMQCTQKKELIFKIAKELKCDIKNLEEAIKKILKKQQEDYLNTFSLFMDSIRKELIHKLEEMEKLVEEKKKANDIRLIKCEREFFRLEAVRLNGICRSFKDKIDEISFRNKLLTDELNTLTTKWKESENINKQLLFELESNIQNHKEVEEELNMAKSLLNKKNDNGSSISDANFNMHNNMKEIDTHNKINSEVEKRDISSEEKENKEITLLNERLRRYKNENRKEKEKAQKALADLNKIYLERSKLESIFNNCVESTKKLIYERKIKENKIYKYKEKVHGKYENKFRLSTKFEEFLPGDKQSTLENFLFNEDVYKIVKDAIFNHPRTSYKKNENVKNILNNYNFCDPDWKMKEIIENASSDISKKNETFLPIMSVPNQIKTNFSKDNFIHSQSQDKNNQFYRTGRVAIAPLNKKKKHVGTSSKLTMNLQIN